MGLCVVGPDLFHRVLLVQTDRRAASGCKAALRATGFEALHTSSPERALCALANAPYHALVIDLDTTRVDALGIVSAVRQHPPTRSLPIVGLFPIGDTVVADLALARGCDRVLLGPVDPARLARELAAMLTSGAALFGA